MHWKYNIIIIITRNSLIIFKYNTMYFITEEILKYISQIVLKILWLMVFGTGYILMLLKLFLFFEWII